MKDQIPEYLSNKLKLTKAVATKFPMEIKHFMTNYAKHYNWNITDDYQLIYKLIKLNISEIPKCGVKGCNQQARIKGKAPFVTTGCSAQHTLELSMLEKYGSTNIMKTEIGKKNFKKSMMEKHGIENPLQSDEILNKIKKTNIKKYGCEWNITSTTSKEKRKKTMIENFGVEYPQQNKNIRENTKTTNMEKYGKEYVFQVDEFQEKFKDTMKKRYGVSHPMHDNTIISKFNKSKYQRKEYIWKTGEISIVQGYEPIVLSELEEQGYKFQDVVTNAELMPEIWYEFDGKQKRYFPDFFIPKENLIIEVKSEYTLQADFEKNQEKFKATKNLGFDFKLEVR